MTESLPRMEKPRRITFESCMAAVMFLLAAGYALGWTDPSRFGAACVTAALGCAYMSDHTAARDEYVTYLRVVKGVGK